MTVNQIHRKVKAILAVVGDDEMAHSMEDQLHLEFITYIASLDGSLSAKALSEKAKAVLKTSNMPFARWCA